MTLGAAGGPPKGARPPSWWAAVLATALQLAALTALLLFVANSLSVSSYTSALLSRDATVASQFAASAGANISNERSFDVERALSDLEQIAQTPHSLNDPRSIDVRDYLRTTIEGIIAGTSAQFSDPVVNGTVAEFKAKGWLVYWEDSSLVVRVPGTGSHAEALLVQAHYDAVPMSHGAYDDGVGVVVCVELLRNLIRYPVRYPVLINIDWGEENGLFGAMLFARFHPWAENVRAYINLEAGGVGGRAMVFRASHPTLLNAYKQAAQKPCASLVGNNAFKLGIVKSDTDYSIYTTSYGLPGLDLAFTDHRNLYHTARDHFREATAESVLSMGAAVLRTARIIADSSNILPSLPRSSRLPARPHPTRAHIGMQASTRETGLQHKGTDNAIKDAVFYDVLSRFMVVRSYSAEMWLNICTGIAGIVIVIALQYPFARPLLASHVTPHASTLALDSSSPAERLVLQLGQDGLFSGLLEGLAHLVKGYMAGLFGSLVFTGLLISMVTPRLAYTHLALFVMLLFSAAALSTTCVLVVWVRRSRLPDMHVMVWHSWCLMCCLVLLLLVAPLNAAGIGLFYRDILYTWASIAAAVLTAMMDPNTHLYTLWRERVDRLAQRLFFRPDPSDSQRERLLHRNSSSEALNGANGDEVSVGDQSNSNQHLVLADGHPLVVGVLFLLSSLRAFVGVFLPLLIGIDTMLRLLIVFKDHLPDGSPPVACTTIAALDIATFVLFLAPYIVSATNDIDQYWLVRWIGLAAAPFLRRLLPAWKQNMLANRHISATRPRSQISLHTNYARHRDSIDAESTRSSFEGGSNGGLTGHGANENEVDDVGERVIVLDSGRRSNPRSVGSNMHAAGGLAGGEESREEESSDEELGNRPVPARFSSTETREMVGRGMIYTWAGVWLALWVGAQLVMLAGEGYTEKANPLKVRVSQSTRVSAECLLAGNSTSSACSQSRLVLSSPDSTGLVRLLNAACPDDVTRACYTRSTRDFYQCDMAYHYESRNGTWSPATAINITSVHHTSANVEHGTQFTVTLNFSAPETRTCFIDFGAHHGFSQQAYPNPRPVAPPITKYKRESAEPHLPAIDRVMLPVIDRARFVDGVTGAVAPIVEPVNERDAVFSGRIYAHKRSFDSNGQFSAVIQYSVPVANASKLRGALVDISCYFDVVDRHAPLLGSIIGAAPKWAIFTPASNTLSIVTVTGVEL